MKNFKKVLLTGIITIATLFTISVNSNAATVKITGEVVNIRKEASTEAKVVAQLSENVECEYLGQEGNWYKVKYQNYTGYVSKEYAKLIGEVSTNTNSSNQGTNNQTTNPNNTQTNSQTNNQSTSNGNNQTNSQASNQNEQTNTQTNSQGKNEQGNSAANNANEQKETTKLVYKKFKQTTIIQILPLVHSSKIGEAKKNEEVLLLTETSGWSYIQTDEISGWVRTDTLGEAKTVTTGGSATSSKSTQDDKTTQTSTSTVNEKVGYISEEYVNMRKGAGTTYAVVKVLKLNATVTILEENGSWYKVTSGNDAGYISKDYVSNTKKVTNRSLTEQREDKDEKENENINDDNQTTTKVSQTNKDDNKSDSSVDNKTTSSKNETNSADKKDTSQSTDKTSNTGSSSATKTNNTSNKTSTTNSSKNEVKGSDIVAYAKKFLGYKYVWGGDGSNGTFDCSGFTMYVYKHFGVSLPHYTVSQYNSGKGKKITKQSELKMGDIVYLTDYISGAPCGHCGIYIENGKFIHADSTVMKVNISDLNGMYKGRFCGALRVF